MTTTAPEATTTTPAVTLPAIDCGTRFASDQAQLQQASQEAQQAATEAQRHLAMLGRIRMLLVHPLIVPDIALRWQCRRVGPCGGDLGFRDCRLLWMKKLHFVTSAGLWVVLMMVNLLLLALGLNFSCMVCTVVLG